MRLSKKINGVIDKAYGKTKKLASKIVKPIKKYAPAAMIMLNSTGSLKAAPADNSIDKKIDAKTITVAPKKVDSKFTFNNMTFDLATMHVEDINVLFVSGNNSAAMYGGKTMETVKDFGPMLNKVADLQKVIEAHPEKYADLIAVIDKYGIRSDEFKDIMAEKYNDEYKRRELTGDIVEDLWVSRYQPICDANAKCGYPAVSYEDIKNPEKVKKIFGYVASIISCMSQSSRQTAGIYKEAMERAVAMLGDKATLDDCIDISYDIRNERWGLDERYFGADGKSGEKYLNKKIREMFASTDDDKSVSRTIAFNDVRLNAEAGIVNKTDAIKVPGTDSLEIMERYDIQDGKVKIAQKSMLETLLTRNDEVNLPTLNPESAGVFLQGLDFSMEQPEQLLEERAKEVEELNKLNKKIEEISTDNFSFLGKKMVIDYEEMSKKPEIIGHYYESGRNPIIKDKKKIQNTTAMGLYQFNMSNTMKVLADKLADEFPLLKQAKDNHGGSVRTADYENAWNFYSLSEDSKERFEKRQLKLMFEQVAGASYKDNFDWMTKHCDAPEITLENYNNPEVCVYTGAMMSASNQSPYRAKFFAKQAYERVKKRSKSEKIDWNEVGIVLNDIKAERWGKKSKALYRRYMGSKNNIGEKQMCEHLNRYVKEMPKLRAQIAERERRIQHLDYALNMIKPNGLDMALNSEINADKTAKTQAIQANKEKFQNIKIHARNMKEWQKAMRMARRNEEVETPGREQAYTPKKTNSKEGKNRA